MSSPSRRSRSYTPARRFSEQRSRSRSGASRSPSPPRTGSRTPSRSPSHRSRSARSRSPRGGSRGRSRERSYEMKRPSGDRERPEANTCLGVFGLSFKTTEEDLEHKFSKFGPLEKVNLVLDGPSRRSRGFGFIYFERQEDATRARDAMDGQELQGFKLRVDYSITKQAHKPTPGVYFHHGKAHKPGENSRGSERRSDRRGGGGRGGGRGGSSRSYRDERPIDYYRPRERERAPYPDYDRDYYDRAYYREDKYYDLAPPPRRDDRYREDRYYEERYYREREYERPRFYERERERRYERSPPPPSYRYEARDRYPPVGKPRRRSPSPRGPRPRY